MKRPARKKVPKTAPDEALAVTAHSEGSVISVRAQAGARTTAIRGTRDGALRISVTQAPEKGKANKVIVGLLADALNISQSRIELVDGKANPQKRFLIVGLSPDLVTSRLRQVLDDAAS